ncbi:MAG: dihydroorotate dehydrogenase electron transfer subunit [Thermincolia bacterium]
MFLQELVQVKTHQEISPGHYLLTLRAPRITEMARPGQFVHVKCSSAMDPLLRRPISLHYINKAAGTITLLYHVVGRGTQLLSQVKVGETLDVMGPLGKGFSFPDKPGHVVVVGGGIGTAPLLPLVEALLEKDQRVTAVMGARSEEYLLGIDQLAGLGANVYLATDDGSRGHGGFVTDLVEKIISEEKVDFAYICGPTPMMKAASRLFIKFCIPGQVSMEERMGCGVGACLACVCRIKQSASGSLTSGCQCPGQEKYAEPATSYKQPATSFDYKKVCVDGPVFNLEEVAWDE